MCEMQDSPNKQGVMGSKSVGEPPLLLSASVMSAFQMAVAAAKEDLAHQHQAVLATASAGAEHRVVCSYTILSLLFETFRCPGTCGCLHFSTLLHIGHNRTPVRPFSADALSFATV